MKTASLSSTINDATRERVIIGVCALLAIALGIVAASSSIELTAALFIVLLFGTAALVLPRAWLGIVLIALIPLEFYFPITASFYLRGALVFVLAAMLRVVLLRKSPRLKSLRASRWLVACLRRRRRASAQANAQRKRSPAPISIGKFSSVIAGACAHEQLFLRPPSWLLPAALFLAVAFIAALGAANRYAALKGIYDYLPIFAAAFVIGETMQPQWLKRFVIALITVGVLEALLGLLQTRFTPVQIAEMLQVGMSEWFYQPNLLRERLADFSFNWVLNNRVLPFGTFINGIDYALFLAAMVGLGGAWWLEAMTVDRRPPTAASSLSTDAHSLGITYHVSRIAYHTFWLIGSLAHWLIPTICVALIGIALLLTYKGSGLLALAGAGTVLVWMLVTTRTTASRLLLTAYCLLGVLLLGIIFSEPLVQRAAFLIQRESGASYETGRLEIWSQAIAALPRRPLFGFGLNNAGQLIAPTQSLRGGTFIVNSNSPESAYVATLVETGIVGFAALLWFIGAILVRAYQRARVSILYAGVLAAIVALLCGNFTVSALTTDQNGLLFGVLIGMVFADDERACL